MSNFLVVLTLVSACEGEERLSPESGIDYFPLRTGLYQVYEVEEIRFQVTSDPVQSNYQLMTHIADSFPSAGNNFTYVIHRSKRQGPSDEWQLLDTWSARKENNAIIVSEGNTSFVKLRFPVAEGNKWDGNAFNSMGEDEYVLKEAGQPRNLDGMTFEKTVTVEQERNEDIIVFRDERFEIYAKDVGLVYREIIQLDYCTADACLGQQKVDEGVEIKMRIVDYGRQ